MKNWLNLNRRAGRGEGARKRGVLPPLGSLRGGGRQVVINKEAVLIRSSQGPISHRPIASVIEVEMDVSMSWTARR